MNRSKPTHQLYHRKQTCWIKLRREELNIVTGSIQETCTLSKIVSFPREKTFYMHEQTRMLVFHISYSSTEGAWVNETLAKQLLTVLRAPSPSP